MVYARRRRTLRPSSLGRLRYASAATARRSAARVSRYRRGGAVQAYRRAYRFRGRRGYIRRLHRVRRAYPMTVSIAAALRAGHPCVLPWLKSLVSPWAGPAEACNPYLPPVYSMRMRIFCRREIDSAAFNVANNAAFICRPEPSNDAGSLFVSTTAAYVGDSTGLTTACPSATNANSPFSSAQFAVDNLSCGIVSMGMRVKYTGTADALSGMMYFYETPGHWNLSTTSSTEVISSQAAIAVPVSQEWQGVVWSGPIRTNEQQFNFDTNATPLSDFVLACLIRGPSSKTFAIEWWANFEVTGRDAVGCVYSEQDQVGAGKASKLMLDKAGGKTVVNTPGVGGGGPSDDDLDAFFKGGGGGDASRAAAYMPFAVSLPNETPAMSPWGYASNRVYQYIKSASQYV